MSNRAADWGMRSWFAWVVTSYMISSTATGWKLLRTLGLCSRYYGLKGAGRLEQFSEEARTFQILLSQAPNAADKDLGTEGQKKSKGLYSHGGHDPRKCL